MKSSVFENGTYAGGHIYGYTQFEVDITAIVHEGENEILVRVDNSMQPGSRWYSGSGITRDNSILIWLNVRIIKYEGNCRVGYNTLFPCISDC